MTCAITLFIFYTKHPHPCSITQCKHSWHPETASAVERKSRAKEETTQVCMNGRKGELSAVLKSLSVVAEEGGGLFGSLGLITTFCREYRS